MKGAEDVGNKGKLTFLPGSFFQLLSQEVEVAIMLLCPHAGLRTVSTKGKREPGKRNVGNWGLATCQEGAPWHQREA